jgi:hypothetical protein
MPCPPPLTTEDDWDGVDLRAFGPSFAAIKGYGDGRNSSIPLAEVPQVKSRVSKERKRTEESKRGVYSYTLFAWYLC